LRRFVGENRARNLARVHVRAYLAMVREKSPADEDRLRVAEGADPTEEIGPSGAEVGPSDAEQRPTATTMGEPPQAAEWSLRSEVDEAFPIEPIPMVLHPADGLPVPVDERTNFAFAAPFTVETVCCIEDESAFVEVFEEDHDDEASRGNIITLTRLHLSSLRRFERSAFNPDGTVRERRRFLPTDVLVRWGQRVVAYLDEVTGNEGYLLVRPVRERCVHYKRQLVGNDDVPDPNEAGHKILFRNCAARRSVGGALLSLRDEAIYACDYRSPPDPSTVERYLDEPDRLRLKSSAHLKHLPMFGLTGEPSDFSRPIVAQKEGLRGPTEG
jgi:hypothetical protein